MPGSGTVTTDSADDIIESVATDTLPSIGAPELENKWRKLLLDIRSSHLETDLEERHSRSNFERAIELALAHPDSMSLSTESMGRRHDMTNHVRSHFDSLLNTDDRNRPLPGPRPDAEYLLKASELAYLYDSVYRFCPETIVRPNIDGLDDVRFIELPDGPSDWMGEVDLLWLTLTDELKPEEDLHDWIDRLYEESNTFVAEAKEREMFLPISEERLDSTDIVSAKVTERLQRNVEVSPERIHKYCFTMTAERF